MEVKIKFDKENSLLTIFNKKESLKKDFLIKADYKKSLEFLKELNSLKSKNNTSIYKIWGISNYFTWPFQQSSSFWSLNKYLQYEEVIKFLLENKIKKVIFLDLIRELNIYLKIYGISTNLKNSQNFKIFTSYILKLISSLVSILAITKLILSRTKNLVYTPDKFSKKSKSDFRFAPIYSYLRSRNINFVEVFHTVFNKDFIKNIFKRKRLAIYLDTFPFFKSKSRFHSEEYDLSVFEVHNEKYIEYLLNSIDKEAQDSLKRIKFLSYVLKFSSIKRLLAVDDPRYVQELIVACKLNGIKTYGFQHGQFTKYHVGWMNYNIPKESSVSFDMLFIWNTYWQNVLLDYSSQYDLNNTAICGLLRKIEDISISKKKEESLNILLPYETSIDYKEVEKYILRLIDLGFKVFFKTRPDMPIDQQLKKYGLLEKKEVLVIENLDGQTLSSLDGVIGVHSTLLHEMTFYNKPIFLMRTTSDLSHRLKEDNLAYDLPLDFKKEDLEEYIKGYKGKREVQWPETKEDIKDILDTILKN